MFILTIVGMLLIILFALMIPSVFTEIIMKK